LRDSKFAPSRPNASGARPHRNRCSVNLGFAPFGRAHAPVIITQDPPGVALATRTRQSCYSGSPHGNPWATASKSRSEEGNRWQPKSSFACAAGWSNLVERRKHTMNSLLPFCYPTR
jgi:hypothetical protein